MRHSYLKLLSRLLILVMALMPLQSVAVSVDIVGLGTVPCSAMADMSMNQNKMDMDKPCHMNMEYAQSCANCDYSSVAIVLLTGHHEAPVRNQQTVATLSIQFTTNTSPPPLRPPINISIS